MAIEESATDRFDAGVSDVILPAQYFGAIRATGLSGEQRLVLAVLVDAINILQRWQPIGSTRKRRIFAEATEWVNMRGSADPFSFDNICDALDIRLGSSTCQAERYDHGSWEQSKTIRHPATAKAMEPHPTYDAEPRPPAGSSASIRCILIWMISSVR